MENQNKKITVRFAPSPTGWLHMGNVRTALYDFFFAKKNNGKFIVRVEDTDRIRSKKEYEDDMFAGLKWLGINYEEKILRQSERTEIYKEKIQELIKKGNAYISKETEGENKEVVRFKNPGGKIKFHDLIRGDIEIDVSDLKDFIIARNINEPVYHLTVVIDDMESGVTHVIRGEDHISNTPRQILIIEALGGTRPMYAHLPLIIAPDKTKLSKRKHGESVSLKYYREKGYDPKAIINFLALIGWNPGTDLPTEKADQEIFSADELIKLFDIEKVQKKSGIFNIEKLNWINREYILKEPKEKQLQNFKDQIIKTKWKDSERLKDSEFIEKLFLIILDRIHRWGEVLEIIENGEFDYLFETPELVKDLIHWKKSSPGVALKKLEQIIEMAQNKKNGEEEKLCAEIFSLAEKEGKGEILWPLRYALSGKEKSPDPFTLIKIIGISESQQRLQKAIETLTK